MPQDHTAKAPLRPSSPRQKLRATRQSDAPFSGRNAKTLASAGKYVGKNICPTVWNWLPDSLRDPAVESERFRRDLKTHLFAVGH